jgi:regulatory protein
MWQQRRAGQGRGEGEEPPAPITGVVTAIVASHRREGRFEVAVDGRAAATVSLELVERLGLRVGLAVDEARGLALADAALALATYDRAVAMLAAHGRSAKELRRRLLLKGARAEHADAAVERLLEAGFLDDAEFARQVARSRVAGRGDSRRRVSQVLAQKGVARDVVDEAVAEVFADEAVDEDALVEEAARKRVRTLGVLDAATRRRRLYGFLARRGHDGAAIRRVMDRVLGEADAAAVDAEWAGEDDDEE